MRLYRCSVMGKWWQQPITCSMTTKWGHWRDEIDYSAQEMYNCIGQKLVNALRWIICPMVEMHTVRVVKVVDGMIVESFEGYPVIPAPSGGIFPTPQTALVYSWASNDTSTRLRNWCFLGPLAANFHNNAFPSKIDTSSAYLQSFADTMRGGFPPFGVTEKVILLHVECPGHAPARGDVQGFSPWIAVRRSRRSNVIRP